MQRSSSTKFSLTQAPSLCKGFFFSVIDLIYQNRNFVEKWFGFVLVFNLTNIFAVEVEKSKQCGGFISKMPIFSWTFKKKTGTDFMKFKRS